LVIHENPYTLLCLQKNSFKFVIRYFIPYIFEDTKENPIMNDKNINTVIHILLFIYNYIKLYIMSDITQIILESSEPEPESKGVKQLQELLEGLPKKQAEITLEELGRYMRDRQEEVVKLVSENQILTRALLEQANISGELLGSIDDKTGEVNASMPIFDKRQKMQTAIVEETRESIATLVGIAERMADSIEKMNRKLEVLNERVELVESEIKGTREDVTGVGKEVKLTGEAITGVGEEVKRTGEAITGVGEEVKGTKAAVEVVGQKVQTVGKEMHERFDDVKSVLNQNFSLIIGKLNTLNGQLSERCEIKYDKGVGVFVNSFIWCILVLLWFVSEFIKTVYSGYIVVKEQILGIVSDFFPFISNTVKLLLRIIWGLFEVSYIVLLIDKLCLFLNIPKLGLYLVGLIAKTFMEIIINSISFVITVMWSFGEPVRDLLSALYKDSPLETYCNWLFNYMMDLFSKSMNWFTNLLVEKVKANLPSIPKWWGGEESFAKREGEESFAKKGGAEPFSGINGRKTQVDIYMDKIIALSNEYIKNPEKMHHDMKKCDALLWKLEEKYIDMFGIIAQYFYNITHNKSKDQERINKKFNAHINRTPNITIKLKEFLDEFQDITKYHILELNYKFDKFKRRHHMRKVYPRFTGKKMSKSNKTRRIPGINSEDKKKTKSNKKTRIPGINSEPNKKTKSNKKRRIFVTNSEPKKETKTKSKGSKGTRTKPNTV